jgi:tetratricopeptide (TPR) repeat protein
MPATGSSAPPRRFGTSLARSFREKKEPAAGELRVNPNHLKLLKKARVLGLSGKSLEASVAYRAFLDREPRHADAWSDYAGQLLKLGHGSQAQQACHTALAINPHHVAALINLGCALMQQDLLAEAEGRFRAALDLDPHRMDVQLFLAECLLNKRDLASVQKALDGANRPGAMSGRFAMLQPRYAELWALFGSVLLKERRYQEAEKACATALQLDPLNLRGKANLGSIQMALGHLEQAEGLFRNLVAKHPREERARLLLITCLARRGDREAVCQEAAKVIQQAPESFLVHMSLMGPYYSLGCWDEYRAEIERFRKVDPTSAYLDYEESFVDLLFGDLLPGWARFEGRLNVSEELRPKRTFTEPAWRGEAFAGKTLLVWAEQGLGDTLMFLRYLPQVKALGGLVLLEAQHLLLDVAATCRGADLLIPAGEPLPPFDLQVSIMSLPWIFRTELSTIPGEVPYVKVPALVPYQEALLEHLALARENTRIGLVWAGNPSHVRDHERSLPAPALAPLAVLPEVTWFSFQLGTTEVPPLPNLVSLAPLLETFSDTAFALSGMDLLITVDTAMAHLAGAMGIPTLLLLAFQPDYRWLQERQDSPWYPTVHLYRQPAYGDWDSVLRQIVTDLTQEA